MSGRLTESKALEIVRVAADYTGQPYKQLYMVRPVHGQKTLLSLLRRHPKVLIAGYEGMDLNSHMYGLPLSGCENWVVWV